jgi:hypothetical protein
MQYFGHATDQPSLLLGCVLIGIPDIDIGDIKCTFAHDGAGNP